MAKTSLVSFISNRLEYQSGNSFSASVIGIAKISIALGISILVTSLLIYEGFREEIQNRIFSVSGHISLRQFSTGTLYEEKALEKNAEFLDKLKKLPEITHIQSFAYKPALIGAENEVSGIVLKGISSDFNFKIFEPNIIQKPQKKQPEEGEIWISQKLAKTMQLAKNKEIVLFFIQNPPRYRKVKITAIFQTGIEDVDNNVAFVSQNLLQELNEWGPTQVGGFEVFVHDFKHMDFFLENIGKELPYNIGLETVTQTYIQLFDWLNVIARNVLVMFILISIVAGFNLAATLLIMVLERRQMIGVFKSMGAQNSLIRKVFVRNGIKIMVQGMLLGNGIALAICFLQDTFKIVDLNPENYYLSSVPISWNWPGILGINIGVLAITWLVILIPVRVVNKINPSEAIRLG